MKPVDRQPLPVQIARILKKEILAGRWRHELPGVRELADLLGTSIPTLQKALAALTGERVLMPVEGKRRRKIAPTLHSPLPPDHPRTLILADNPLPFLWPLNRGVLEGVILKLQERGYGLHYQACPDLTYPHPAKVMDHLLPLYSDHLWILLSPMYPAIEWLKSTSVKALLIGGEVRDGHSTFPCIAKRLAAQVAKAADQLISVGHRDIVYYLDLFGEFGRAIAIKTVKETYAAAGLRMNAERALPRAPYTTSMAFTERLEELFRDKPPTAIYVQWIGQALAVSSFCMRKGIRLPEDLSLFVGELDAGPSWHTPAFSGHMVSPERYIQPVVRWVESGGTCFGPGLINVEPEFVPGETIALPRR